MVSRDIGRSSVKLLHLHPSGRICLKTSPWCLYDAEWPELFRRFARELRAALQHRANRVDHIGSTSIVCMSAKPILDIQISVTSLEPVEEYKASLESVGFNWRADNPDLTKRYFREVPGNGGSTSMCASRAVGVNSFRYSSG